MLLYLSSYKLGNEIQVLDEKKGIDIYGKRRIEISRTNIRI